MQKVVTLAFGAILAASAAMAGDAVEGTWQTVPDDNGNFGHIKVAACGAAICGTLVKSFDNAGKPMKSDNIGKQIIWDMVPNGDGTYGNGKVWSPDRDKTYNSKMVLNGNSPSISGCVLGICRDGGTWMRVK